MQQPTQFRALCHCCGLRFAWSGTMFDMPPCPRCGQCMSPEEMQLAQLQMGAAARENTLKRFTRRPASRAP